MADPGRGPAVGVPDVLRHHRPVQGQEQSVQGLARDPVQNLLQHPLVGFFLYGTRGHGRAGDQGDRLESQSRQHLQHASDLVMGLTPVGEDLLARYQAGVLEHLPGGGDRIEGVGLVHQGSETDPLQQ